MIRQIGKEALRLAKRVGFIVGHVVDHSVSAVNLCPAEFLFRETLLCGLGDDAGPTGQHLRRVPCHDREVRGDQSTGRKTCDRSERDT